MKNSIVAAVLALFTSFVGFQSSAQNISTIAGAGNLSGEYVPDSVGQINPFCVIFNAAGDMFLSDYDHDVIKKVDAGTGLMHTIAGTGVEGYSGDGGPATNAMLHNPGFMAIDRAGDLYFSDELNYRVRKINASGIITTIAGTGATGYNGDGITAVTANLFPTGLAFDTSGNLYVSDIYYTNRIRKISTAGIISTIAGDGTYGFAGDGGPATNAYLAYPGDIKINRRGEILFSDVNNNSLRKISTSGIINTIAGLGTTGGTGGRSADGDTAMGSRIAISEIGLMVDTFDNIFFAEYNSIRKINAAGILSTPVGRPFFGSYYGDGGPATDAIFSSLKGFTRDAAGNLYIADQSNYVVRKVDASGIIHSVIGNNFPEYSGDRRQQMNAIMAPRKIRFDTAGNLYFADNVTHTIRKISPSGHVTRIAGYGATAAYYGHDGDRAILASLGDCLAVAPDRKGNVYIADRGSFRIRKVDTAGIITAVAGNGTSGYYGDGGPATNALIRDVWSIATDSIGNVYFPDLGNNRVRKISTSGTITTVAGNGTAGNSGDGGQATAARIYYPREVAIDRSGDLYITDDSNRIRKVNHTTGIINTIAGTGTPGYTGDGGPATAANITYGDMSFDRHGNLLLCQKNNVIRKIDASGIITTVAGTAVAGFYGDGGPATNAKLNTGYGAQADFWGNIYIADDSNGRIRFVCANDTIVDAVGITASTTAICAGQPVTFSATDTNAGPSPFYQWVINGTNVSGATTATFTSTTLSSTDTVWCEMTGNNPAPCAINNRDTSNKIIIAVTPVSPTPSITSVSATPPSIAYLGQPITFNATVTGGGSSPVLQWYKNGIAISGATTNPYTSTTINPGDVVLLSVHTSNPCASPDSARSATITMPSTIGVSTPSASNEKISLYPNPNDGSFTLKGSITGSREYNIEITDPVGKVIYQDVVSTTSSYLDTSVNLDKRTTPGLYFIRIQSGEVISVYRFVVE